MAGIVGAGIGLGFSFLSRDRGSTLGRKFQNLTTPGFQFTTGTERSKLERTGTLLGNIDPAQKQLFGDLGELRSEVRPGFGRFTRAAVEAVRFAADKARGNLRNQLSRRRILGSNFGSATEAAQEAEFAQLEERTRSRALLEEIAVSTNLIERQTSILQAEVARELSEFGVAAQLQSSIAALIAGIGRDNARIAADQSRGRGEALGAFTSEISALGDR